jgi:aspartate/methionine/tyrosine aminotransferase
MVEYNLSESSVQPLTPRELFESDHAGKAFLDIPLGYSQADGTPQLKSAIAAVYKKATPENIMVTTGSSEANLIAAWHLFEKGDEVVLMAPDYAQVWGLAKTFGLKIKPCGSRRSSDGSSTLRISNPWSRRRPRSSKSATRTTRRARSWQKSSARLFLTPPETRMLG